ncbi:hypothetical protein CDO52_01235 [Nocardiopsis gilva YIM 90087]|uniref:VOC domain-containing protein n=1 Tax=Nocardiopsis gilva YIM 90087 TaxID=1235441 RepID=A0A223S0Q6_9ACTN|nr:ADP-ribosylglycohydrolase family protein [Nocardiopsis gilva]ASU81599.1 hypothetical protein CDO52_01235 [Nocardiopsis gilva YIM 90087]
MTEPTPVDWRDRSQGTLLGAAVGDALGWPQEQRSGIVGGRKARRVEPRLEFRPWTRWGGGRFTRYKDPVAAGEYSDDTQLLLATARACLTGDDWLTWLTDVELRVWSVYQRGGGRAVLKATRAWARGTAPWRSSKDEVDEYFAAGGNGAAMRVAPHALLLAEDGCPQDLVRRIVLDGMTTHGHPRALVGAVVYGLAVWHTLRRREAMQYGGLVDWLLTSADWSDLAVPHENLPDDWLRAFAEHHGHDFRHSWENTGREMRDLLRTVQSSLERGLLADDDQALRQLGCFDAKVNGAGTISAAAACYIAERFAVKPQAGLRKSAFLADADTDTLASMSGGLLGAVHGTKWLDGLTPTLQDHGYIGRLAERLSPPRPDVEPASFPAPDTRAWLESVAAAELPDTFVDGRGVRDARWIDLESSGKQRTARLSLTLDDGQHVMIDRQLRTQQRREPAVRTETAAAGRPEVSEHRTAEPPTVTRVALQVRNLSETRNFYAGVLGVQVRESERALYVGSWLAFVEGQEDPHLTLGPTAQVVVACPDPKGVEERLKEHGIQPLARGPDDVDGSLRVRDPDDNEVLLWPPKTRSG